MKNLEIKVKVKNLGDIKNRLGFSKYEKTLEQTDTYFLMGETQLKVREEKTGSEIIFYRRKLQEGTRESHYSRIHIFSSSTNFTKAIFRLIFGVKVVVIKKRDLYMYKSTRIHLDTVMHLGEFVELETVIPENIKQDKDLVQYQREHEEVKQTLALSLYPTIAGSYSGMIKPYE